MRKRLTALFSVAALCATFMVATVAPASAGIEFAPVDFGFGCDFETDTVYIGIQADEDIVVDFAEIGIDGFDVTETVEFLHEDTGDPVGELLTGERAWAAVPESLRDGGPPWLAWVELEIDEVPLAAEASLEFDPCAFELEVAGECADDGSAIVTVTAVNDTTTTIEFVDGEVIVVGVGVAPLVFDPTEIAAGTSATSEAIELPGDLDADGVVQAEFLVDGAMNVWPYQDDPFDLPYFLTWLFSIDGCDVEDDGGEGDTGGTPPGGGQQPAAAVRTDPAFTG